MPAGTSPASSRPGSVPGDPGRGPPDERPPFLLDFYPLEEERFSRLSRFFDALHEGRLTTTRCPNDGTVTWPPRVVCPTCHREELEWIDLPMGGTIYACSAVLVGAPLGMESEMPFAVGLVDLDGTKLRLFGRIVGRSWERIAIGDRVSVEPLELPDGRVFYRFRAASTD